MTIIPREIVQLKQHTFSCVSMVRIFRVLTYMYLHAREIRLFVYQTIKWHLLKQVDLRRSPRRILTRLKKHEKCHKNIRQSFNRKKLVTFQMYQSWTRPRGQHQ